MTRQCPQCGSLTASGALRCQCGYDFAAGPLPSAESSSIRTFLFTARGRTGRSTYWLKFLLPLTVIYSCLVLVDAAVGTWDAKERVGLLATVFGLSSLYSFVAVSVKRCHDRERSGWFFLVSLIPVVNLWALVELGLLPGTAGPNRYGLPRPSAIRHDSPRSRAVAINAVAIGVLFALFHRGAAIFVVPTFAKMFADLGGELPAGTWALLSLSRSGLLSEVLTLIDVGALLIWFRVSKKNSRHLLFGLVPIYVVLSALLIGGLYYPIFKLVTSLP